MGQAVAELRFVTQSENRAKVLDIVSEEGPIERAAVESRLDVSHRTVVRVVNSLEERGYLREADGPLRLTPLGTHVADGVDAFRTRAGTALDFEPLLRHAPPAFRSLPLEGLADGELLVASDVDPFGILDRILSLRADATRIREVAPGVQRESIDQLAARVQGDEDIDVEVVIPQRASDVAESRAEYRDGHAATVESDAVDVYVHPDRISFFAGVMDDTAAVAVSKEGRPHALAVSDDPDLLATVESMFETYRDESTQKTGD